MIDCKTCIHGKVCGYRADDEGQEGKCPDYLNSADVRPVVRGKWLYDTSTDEFACSVCDGLMVRNVYSYCPWCGADMRRVSEE